MWWMNRQRWIAGWIIAIGLILVGVTYQVEVTARHNPEVGPRQAFAHAAPGEVGGSRLVSSQGAQTATPTTPERLTYGNSVTREFAANAGMFTFTFQAQEGDVITLTMVADRDAPIDPALILIGPDGSTVARNDDSLDITFGVTNARLVNYPIPASGTYTIEATRSTDTNGGFTLSLRATRTGVKPNANLLDFGENRDGSVTANAVRATYQFYADGGDVISIVVQRTGISQLVPYVVLLDESGKTLTATNPAERAAGTARITQFPLLRQGTYSVAVSRVGEEKGASSGAFTLSLTRNASYGTVVFGDTVDGALDSSLFETGYVFGATAGDVITITMARKTGSLDSILTLVGAGGRQLTSNDNSSAPGLKTGDAQISRFQIPETANYIVMAGRKGKAQGKTSGSFRLSLELIKAAQQRSS
jgi:hypothetical protein